MNTRAMMLGLVFLGVLAFGNAIRHPFVHDDVYFILHDPHIAQLDQWHQAFKVQAATGGLNTYYRPLLEIFYRLEYHFFGFNPAAFHSINVLLHIINGLLLFSLLLKLGLERRSAWVVALLFLVHPVQTEAVSCISGISNLWMALGVLLALHAYLNQWYATSLLCFAMGFLGKEQAVLFLPLVVVIDLSRGQAHWRSWGFFGLATLFLLWFRQVMSGSSLLRDVLASPGEFYLRLEAIPRDIGMYLRLIFFPYDLHYYRSTDILQSNILAWIMAIVVVAGLVYAWIKFPKARPIGILGLGWFWACLLPVLNIAPLINEYSFILTPEHFLYLPMAGIMVLVVCGLDHALKHFKTVLVAMAAGLCILLTWHQNTYWANETVLFERMMQFEPQFGRGHWLLAKAYSADGRVQEADRHFRRAYEIMSGYARKATNLTAKRFYLRYMDQILFDWGLNKALERGA